MQENVCKKKKKPELDKKKSWIQLQKLLTLRYCTCIKLKGCWPDPAYQGNLSGPQEPNTA